jgi:hypothetical protein
MSNFSKNTFAVSLFQKALGFSKWIQALPGKMMPPPMRLIQIGSLYWQSRALYVAAKLDIASLMGDQKLAIHELAGKASCHADSLYRLLRVLISMGVFDEPEPGIIANNQTSYFLDTSNPKNVRDMILMHNSPEMTQAWIEELENGVRSGEIPFSLANGDELFGYMETHPEFGSLFAKAMDCTEAIVGNTFLTDFDWEKYERIIDVGGSKGSKSIAILKLNPKLKAVVFDRPQVIAEARNYWEGKVEESVLERIEFIGGDAREGVPGATGNRDIYLLCGVLHGLSDDDSIKILKNIRLASESYQADLAVMDAVLAEQNESLMLTSFDMQMLMATEGRERTAIEWADICASSGFKIQHVFDTRSLWKLQLLTPETK